MIGSRGRFVLEELATEEAVFVEDDAAEPPATGGGGSGSNPTVGLWKVTGGWGSPVGKDGDRAEEGSAVCSASTAFERVSCLHVQIGINRRDRRAYRVQGRGRSRLYGHLLPMPQGEVLRCKMSAE
jgi:hypothetical protein